jgi:F-type H+-transporting ATPase subunit b
MFFLAEFWVAVAFLVFLGVLVYYKIPALIGKALDDRAEVIRKELDEARRVREEAQGLLADYQRKHRTVGEEAEAIVAQARQEAEAFAQETRRNLKATERRTAGRAKIARAKVRPSMRCVPPPSIWPSRRPKKSCAKRRAAPRGRR